MTMNLVFLTTLPLTLTQDSCDLAKPGRAFVGRKRALFRAAKQRREASEYLL